MADTATEILKNFDFDVALNKAYTDSEGTMHVIGVASDDDVDRTGDKMSDMALDSMAQQANKNKIPLMDSHHGTFGFGHTHSGSIVKSGARKELHIDFALDKRYPQAQDLYNEVSNGKSQKQLSIGGNINRADPDAVGYERDNKSGDYCRVIKKISLDHIATTRPKRAAVPGTRFISAIVKSLFDGEVIDKDVAQKKFEEEAKKQATTTAPPEAPRAPETAALGKEAATHKEIETMSDQVNKDAQKNLETGINALANLGALINKTTPAGAPALNVAPMPEHIQAFDKAISGLITSGIVDKNLPDVQKMVGSLHKFLSGQGRQLLDAEDAKKAAEVAAKSAVNPEMLQAVVDKSVAAHINAAVERIEKSLLQFAEALNKGLTELGSGMAARVEASNKAADERVSKLEKLSGVRQSMPGQDDPAAVNKSIPPAAGGERPSRQPDEKNVFRGVFDGSIKTALSQMGRAAATKTR